MIGWIAIVWVCFIVVLFMLPQYAPGTPGDPTFNYAPVAVATVLVFSTAMWFAVGRQRFMHGAKGEHTTKALDEIV